MALENLALALDLDVGEGGGVEQPLEVRHQLPRVLPLHRRPRRLRAGGQE